jgi:alkylation response protein AidB-like acyl-CoA dehydrogenase
MIARAEQAAVLLAPLAAQTERDGVERATLDGLAGAGLYGVAGPESITGAEPSAAVYREVAEVLSGADGNTWFVWLQHHAVVKMLAASANGDLARRWLPSLCAGTTQAGVAYSHLRSSEVVISATRMDGGWRLSGTAPWCTGWDLLDVVLVGATTTDDEVVFALVPMREGDGMAPGPTLDLAAMGGTRTVELHLDGYGGVVPDVVLRMPRAAWAATDAAAGADVQPSTFGIARAALAELAGRDEATATSLSSRLNEVRRRAYGFMDGAPAGDALDERLALRAEALRLGVEATSALVASVGGRAMTRDHPAQRWAREALFHLVFAQTRPARATTLARIAGHPGAISGGP